MLRCNRAGKLLLDAKERYPHSCSFQEVQDANVEGQSCKRRRSELQTTKVRVANIEGLSCE